MASEELVPGSDIAVIGMACRFPGAKNPAEYWRNLRDGVESVRFMTDEELAAAGVDPEVIANPDYVKASIVLEEMEMFDAGFFGFSPKDAAIMDPQHRHFLECSWEALESAGHNPDTFQGSIGVYGGCGMGAYFMYNCLTNRQLMESTGLFLVRHTGNDKDFLTTRVSYQFNLRGPSVNVQTACSTSLVAIHLACQNLLNGECDMALAGGVTIEMPHYRGYMYQDGEILARDGHCRAFDHRSTGTIFGSGAGVVVLRRLEDALRDGDPIHAVIKGSAINNDGSQKVGYLAPSVDGQAAAISEALNVAGFAADTVTYIETHGTGTAVGDPIEITALTEAFRRTTDKKGFCGIGSVKTNIGHLDTAAGVASFIKAVEALLHKQLPPSLHFEKPNPLIDFASSPFYVNASLQEWTPPAGVPRRAGVSSLGVGGTNAHIVIEEAPEAAPPAPSTRPFELLTLSARTETALDRAARNLAAKFRSEPGTSLADAAYTLAVGRKPFRYRRVLAARTLEDAAQALEAADTKRIFTHQAPQAAPSIVFLFPGGGAQYPQMGRDLYEREEVYRRHADECLAILKPQIDVDLKGLMFPPESELEAATAQLERPLYSILSIFITEYALAKLWMSWGITPAAMTGHSLGEYTAACLAGVISLDEAISLVVARGKIFERMPAGGMLSVQAPEADVRKLLTARMSIAAANAPTTCVVSGEDAALDELAKTLTAREIDCARLKISVAAHSPMLDPFLDEFAAHAKGFTLRAPSIQYVSNLTGNWVKPEDLDATYWVRHLRNTVRFADGLAVLLEDPNRVLLEVGPGTTLSSLVRQQPGKKPAHVALNSMRHPKETGSDAQYFLTTFGRLWASGVPVDWQRLYGGEQRRRIPLPTYSFDHQRHWIEPGKAVYTSASAETAAPAKLTRSSSINDWFYRPDWKKTPLADTPAPAARRCWLIFRDGEGLGAEIADQLHTMGQDVITVDRGDHFQGLSETHYVINPGDRTEYDSLVSALIENGRIPQKVVHLWAVARDAASEPLAALDEQLDSSFFSLLFFTQALAGEDLVDTLDITIVATGIRQVDNQPETLAPARATLLGPCLVIPQELPGVTCRAVDVVLPRAGSGSLAWQIIAEAATAAPVERVIAYRGENRWAETWAQSPIEGGEPLPSRLRKQGVYLITGGLGDIALTQADMLARKWQARLALVSRTGLPAREQWAKWLETHSPDDFTARRIRQVQALEAQGSEVLVLRADVTDLAQFRAAVNETAARFGAVNGVIHTAGVINDGVIQEKTRREAEQVLAPKVRGTLVIEEALRGQNPDFVLLFSSTSALLGLAGQVDYTAANAFLDAWAQSRSGRNAPYTVSVDWGVWQGVGMAASAVRPRETASGPAKVMAHPLLGSCTVDSPSLVAYQADYRVDGMWVLSEHKLKGGECLLPGTGYLELAKAALEKGSPAAVEIRDLFFLAPLEVKADAACAVGITLKKEGGAFALSVTSRTQAGEMEHARAEVSFLHAAEAPRDQVAAISARCSAHVMRPEPGRPQTKQEEHLDFGPRWKNLVEMRFGQGEALAQLELPQENAPDLAAWTLHPAVMDQATCFALPLLQDYDKCGDLFVPLSYKRVRAYAPLPRRVWSHVRLKRDDHVAHGVAVFNVRIMDESGAVVVEVEEFAVRRLTEKISGATMGSFKPAMAAAGGSPPSDAQSRLQAWVQDGIRPAEGADALERILLRGAASQFAASPLALPALIEQTRPKVKMARASDVSAVEGADAIETNLLHWWSDLLGVEKVGLNDDFFDLGGQSLVAVRLFTKIKKTYQVDLGLATLFEARTVRQLAEVFRNQGAKGDAGSSWSALVPLQKGNGTKPILFCVHGVGGNVLGYNALVRYLPPDQPFYAIQGQGLNRKQKPITNMQEMAAYYVKEIRTVQPHGPYYLSGYSFGGVAAFEMACQLEAAGERVAMLVMFDSDRPNTTLSLPTRLRLHAEVLWKASPQEKLKHLKRKAQGLMRRLRKPPAKKTLQPQESSAENFRDVRASNFKAYHGYHSGVYTGKITLFRANKMGESGIRKPDLGWTGKALGGIETHWIPGDHIDILYEPNVPVPARKLIECLDRVYGEKAARAQVQEEAVRR